MSGVEREAGAAVVVLGATWAAKPHRLLRATVIVEGDSPVAITAGDASRDVQIARAELIARAVNSHADLLAALQEAMIAMSAATVHLPVNELPRIACNTAIAKARAAIAKANGQEQQK